MNTGNRISTHVTLAQALNLIEAADFAFEYLGLPLNRFITIHWTLAGLKDRPQQAHSIFMKYVGEWCRLRGIPLAALYVFENPPDGSLHEHILLHVPLQAGGEFRNRQAAWLKMAGAQWPRRARVIKTKPVGDPRFYHYSGEYLENLIRLLEYFLKGADARTQDCLGIRPREPQGRIVGKRCGVSEAIGPRARRLASITEPFGRPLWNPVRVIPLGEASGVPYRRPMSPAHLEAA